MEKNVHFAPHGSIRRVMEVRFGQSLLQKVLRECCDSGSDPTEQQSYYFLIMFSSSHSYAGLYTWRKDRPAVLVSSTSWTADEDFSILLEAIRLTDEHPDVPPVVLIITGPCCIFCHLNRSLTVIVKWYRSTHWYIQERVHWENTMTLKSSKEWTCSVCLH